MTRTLRALVMTASVFATTSAARADTFTWINPNGGNWDDPANWLGGNVPQGLSTDQLAFSLATAGTTITGAHDPWTLNGLSFVSLSFTNTNTQGLRFDGTNPFINRLTASYPTLPITVPIILDQTTTYTDLTTETFKYNFKSEVLTFANHISGPGAFVLQNGAVAFNTSNSFSGGVTIKGSTFASGGTVNGQPRYLGSVVNTTHSNGLGTGPITLDAQGKYASFGVLSDGNFAMNNDIIVIGATNRLYAGPLSSSANQNATASFGKLVFGPGDSILHIGLDYSGPSNFAFASSELRGNATMLLEQISSVALGPISENGDSYSLRLQYVNGPATSVTLSAASSYSGGTSISGFFSVNANSANALGSGPVDIQSGSLALNATNAARNTVTGTGAATITYNANGAAGGHLITAGALFFSNAVTSFSNGSTADTFATTADGTISANAALLSLLDRNANFAPGFNTVVFNADGGLPTIQNPGTAADLLIGISSSLHQNLTLGAGTPYRGLAGRTFTGTVTARSELFFSNVTLGNATTGSFTILADAGISPVAVTLNNVSLSQPTPDFSGVDTFTFTGRNVLAAANVLGGAGASLPRPAIVQNAELFLTKTDALNANVTFHGGSLTYGFTSGNLNGIGALSRDSQPLTFNFNRSATALSGAQLTPGFIQPGDTVIINANNFIHLSQIDPAANITFATIGNTSQSEPINIDGGSIAFNSSTYASTAPINVGPQGASLRGRAASSDRLGFVSNIVAPIVAAGPVRFDRGAIALGDTANVLPIMEIGTGAQLYVPSPAHVANSIINLNGGWITLRTPVGGSLDYPNTLNVLSNATLDTQLTPSGFSSQVASPATLAAINIGNSTLTISAASATTVNYLHLTGDATLSLNSFGVDNGLSIKNITQDATRRALTLNAERHAPPGFVISGLVAITGPVHVNTFLTLTGTIGSSDQPFLVGDGGMLAGTGVIHRNVTFLPGLNQLSPGGTGAPLDHSTSSVGTLTLDSLSLDPSTTLVFTLDLPQASGPSLSDLVAINGDLTLDGTLLLFSGIEHLITPGSYTLFNYTGALIDNGLLLDSRFTSSLDLSIPGKVNLVITPEPASLSVLLPTLLLLRRQRR